MVRQSSQIFQKSGSLVFQNHHPMIQKIKQVSLCYCLLSMLLYSFACNDNKSNSEPMENEEEQTEKHLLSVEKVEAKGSENAYTFYVTLASPDTGCDQYANWWEVLSTEGELIYRRILAHSHVNEQPFTRSGGTVKIAADQQVWIRAHMNNTSYSKNAFKGSVNQGFSKSELDPNFAATVESQEPQAGDCNF